MSLSSEPAAPKRRTAPAPAVDSAEAAKPADTATAPAVASAEAKKPAETALAPAAASAETVKPEEAAPAPAAASADAEKLAAGKGAADLPATRGRVAGIANSTREGGVGTASAKTGDSTRGRGAGVANSTHEVGDDATAAPTDSAGIDKAHPATFDSTRRGGKISGRKRRGRFRSGHTQADESPRCFIRGAVAEAI